MTLAIAMVFAALGASDQAFAGSLLVSTFSPNIQKFDATSGDILGTVEDGAGEPTQVMHLTFGPDGNLYATNDLGIRKYDAATGAVLGTFGPPGVNFGHLAFGPDGLLYVSRPGLGQVQRFDAGTGDFDPP